MKKVGNKRKSKVGLPPGSLVFTGNQKVEEVTIDVIAYNEDGVEEKTFSNLDSALEMANDSEKVVWINVTGLHDLTVIENFGNHYGLHKLTLEDVLNVSQRPKFEEFDDYIYVVVKMLGLNSERFAVESEQLSFILKGKTLISFQEKSGDVFEYIRKRILVGKGNIRNRAGDYLLYALIDSIVDHYFLLIENLGEELDQIEYSLFDNPNNQILERIHVVKKEMLQIRRSVYPLREVVARLERSESPLILSGTRIFIRDVYDHSIHVIETLEILRDMASGMSDLYMSSLGNKMNNIMKVLTIIATIFIPLTFVAGVYGMNFENMPELEWEWGYYGILGFMLAIIIGMVYYFRVKKWL